MTFQFWKAYLANKRVYDESVRASTSSEPHDSSAQPHEAPDAAAYNYEKLVTDYRDLIQDFQPRYLYFEMVDWLRKAIFTGALLFIYPGSTMQLFVGIVLSIFFLLLQTVVMHLFARRAVSSLCTRLASFDYVLCTSVGLMMGLFVIFTAVAIRKSFRLGQALKIGVAEGEIAGAGARGEDPGRMSLSKIAMLRKGSNASSDSELSDDGCRFRSSSFGKLSQGLRRKASTQLWRVGLRGDDRLQRSRK